MIIKRLLIVFLSLFLCTSCSVNESLPDLPSNVIQTQETPIKLEVKNEWSLNTNIQDGCVYNNYLFTFDSEGKCFVFDLTNKELLCSTILPNVNGLLPHSNCVCFGKKMNEDDEFPLLYTNVYNNYSNNEETYGLCFVYKITKTNICSFSFRHIQTIKVSFIDSVFWHNNSNNNSPYGNFLVYDDFLFVYLNIFGSKITRFFKFPLPLINPNFSGITYLDINNVIDIKDFILFKYIQGGTIYNDYLYSLEGFNESCLRIINLTNDSLQSVELTNTICNKEPEFISFLNNYLIIGDVDGHLYYCYFI